MENILQFLKTSYESVTIIMAFAALFGINLKNMFDLKRQNKELKKSIDSQQSEDIKESKNSQRAIIDYIMQQKYYSELRKNINKSIKSVIKSYNGAVDNPIKGLLRRGGREAYYFFKELHQDGLENIEISDIRDGAISLLREMRGHTVGAQTIDYSTLQYMKVNAAYPEMQKLLVNLQSSDLDNEEYQLIVIDFIKNFVSANVAAYVSQAKP